MLKSLVLMLIGYYFGQAIGKVNSFLEFASYMTAAIVLTLAAAAFIYYRRKEVE